MRKKTSKNFSYSTRAKREISFRWKLFADVVCLPCTNKQKHVSEYIRSSIRLLLLFYSLFLFRGDRTFYTGCGMSSFPDGSVFLLKGLLSCNLCTTTYVYTLLHTFCFSGSLLVVSLVGESHSERLFSRGTAYGGDYLKLMRNVH